MDRGSIQTGIWLIGLGVLFWTGYWWPGILILIGVSMVAGVLAPSRSAPSRSKEASRFANAGAPVAPIAPAEEAQDSEPAATDEEIPPALGTPYAPPKAAVDARLLPEVCPNCGAPVRQNVAELVFSDDRTTHCPYCDATIRLLAS